MSADADKEVRAVKRKLANARRELRKAVTRFDAIPDPLRGHKVEAVRRAREVRDAAQAAVEHFEHKEQR